MTWVFVYRPGDELIYQAVSSYLPPQDSLKMKIVRKGLKALFAAAQLWFWVRS